MVPEIKPLNKSPVYDLGGQGWGFKARVSRVFVRSTFGVDEFGMLGT